MRTSICKAASIVVVLGFTASVAAAPQKARPIDVSGSSMRVYVYKTGFFSVFAHNHVIEAPIESGEINESGSPATELSVDARRLRVLDPEVSPSTRAQIQEAMEGPKVLDARRFPEIQFQSVAVEAKGAARWIVRGNLDLHGQRHPVTVDVTLKNELYRGSATVKQTDFGIQPIRIAGGTVKVKNEVKVEFRIALAN